jgi:hypothetical protein
MSVKNIVAFIRMNLGAEGVDKKRVKFRIAEGSVPQSGI